MNRDQIRHTRPHVDNGVCEQCRKKIQPTDRVTIAYIVDRVGADPRNLSRQGLHLFEEFAFVHINCKDPKLVKGGD